MFPKKLLGKAYILFCGVSLARLWEIYHMLNILCCLSKGLIGTKKDTRILLNHVKMVPNFYVEQNLEEIINFCDETRRWKGKQ